MGVGNLYTGWAWLVGCRQCGPSEVAVRADRLDTVHGGSVDVVYALCRSDRRQVGRRLGGAAVRGTDVDGAVPITRRALGESRKRIPRLSSP
jgi:hypothetical protein